MGAAGERAPVGRAGRGARAALLALLAGLAASSPGGLAGPTRPGPALQGSPAALLPGNGAVPGWDREGDAQEFAGEDLYTYIDGGAEIYHEYGFRRVAVQDYKDAGGRSVSLEIFEMDSPEAAYGIYSFKRSGKGKSVPLGAGGDLEDYYLNFWEGRYLATLTGFDESPGTIAGLQALAAAVDACVADPAGPPALVAELAPAGLRPGSVKYVKGLLGLNNLYPFSTARGLTFRSAVKGDYEDGTAAILLDYGREDVRAQAWDELRAGLEASARFKRIEAGGDGTPVFQDPKGRYAAFRPDGPRLVVGIGASIPAARERLR